MHRHKRWIIEPTRPQAAELAARLKLSPLLAQMLLNRGIENPEDARAFLNPSLNGLADPALLPGMRQAAERIAKAVRDRQRIVIYGDYDVDGITATSILWHAITLLGGDVHTYIPHRIDEGYGLNSEALAQIIDGGAQLVVTVDCGITAIEPARIAKERGVDLIITDHHEWHGTEPILPDCFAIVHPRLPGEKAYPNPYLCGAGVAFKLAWGIGQAAGGAARVSAPFREFLIEATALAALGTIADVVPLVGENRILAHFGLGGLKASKLTGIRALIESAGLSGQKLDSYHVGFLLAPRLNAIGRMGHARLAVELLTTADAAKALEIAGYLEEQNRDRQAVEKKILDEAMAQIETNHWANNSHRGLVLASENWHAGVIGIVASRIVDRFCRPTVMIALSNGQGQGSARSINGFHLSRALESCGQYLLAYGGHEMAAGLKIDSGKLEEFRAAFGEIAGKSVTEEMLTPNLRLECVADLREINEPLVRGIERLGPFGHRNSRPLLCLKDVTVAAPPRCVGKTGDHLQLMVKQNGQSIRCIAFGCAELADRLPTGTRINLAAQPGINEFNGRSNVELQVKDISFNSNTD
ncbi:MAG: single-stranded-DNA-specific exonuclease RecJ [Tepidisphaeraceae bacterium]|jgi:single-stranded-DNA-specific exonuclease